MKVVFATKRVAYWLPDDKREDPNTVLGLLGNMDLEEITSIEGWTLDVVEPEDNDPDIIHEQLEEWDGKYHERRE